MARSRPAPGRPSVEARNRCVLRRNDVQVNATAAEPHTTTELLESLDAVGVKGRAVALVHYGERNDTATDALRRRGAVVDEAICSTVAAAGRRRASRAARECCRGNGRRGCRDEPDSNWHVFQIAERLGKSQPLADALSRKVVVAAVGPVCRGASFPRSCRTCSHRIRRWDRCSRSPIFRADRPLTTRTHFPSRCRFDKIVERARVFAAAVGNVQI